MAKICDVRCWISDYQLGLGVNEEEAHLNALNNDDACELVIEGGIYKYHLLVHRGTIQRPTHIRVIPPKTAMQRIDGFRTINVGYRGTSEECAEIAGHLVDSLKLINQQGIAVAHIIASIGGILTSPPSIVDLEDAPDELIATGHEVPPPPEPTVDELKSIAVTLAGPEHEVGDVIPPIQSTEPEDLSNTDMNEPHTYENSHENVDGATQKP